MRGSENGNRYSPTGREVLTRSGLLIDLLAPKPEQIRLSDIAASLAHQERFTGHCPLHPTVAEHSVAVEHIGAQAYRQRHGVVAPIPLRRALLMHDAAEYLVSDLSGAVKWQLRSNPAGQSRFDRLESRAQAAIAARFDIDFARWEEEVHEADCMACAYEMAYGGWCAEARPPSWLVIDRHYRRHGGGALEFVLGAEDLRLHDYA